jgi:hypothetical protein
MTTVVRNKGPWTHRLLIWLFTVAFGLLCFWLSGFVLNDIGTWPGPDYQELARQMIDQRLLADEQRLNEQGAALGRAIENDTRRQQVLRDSTAEAQRTMSQLLDFQRLAIEKGVTPTPEEQQALADSQRIFLENQQRYQELNQQIARLNEDRRKLEDLQRDLEGRLADARRPVQVAYDRLWEQHRWRMAALKLGVMLPLLLLAGGLFLKWRGSFYVPLVYAFGAAVVLRVGLVMHEYFPARYFKYIWIGATLLVVLRVLIFLVQAVARPNRDWLLRQYREAYERFLCPVCEYPIRRGPLKFLFWTRRSAKKLPRSSVEAPAERQPYTCPVCATRLYEECPACHEQRHSLLPACEHCGATRSLEEVVAAGR